MNEKLAEICRLKANDANSNEVLFNKIIKQLESELLLHASMGKNQYIMHVTTFGVKEHHLPNISDRIIDWCIKQGFSIVASPNKQNITIT